METVQAASSVQVGEPAPDFMLPDAEGRLVRLRDLNRAGPVVLYFYPRDFTFNCTREACAFRDDYERFRAQGAQVVGVSSDRPETHGRFARRHRLPFPLLTDRGARVRKLYGVAPSLGIPGRVTFVIDASGTVRAVERSQFRPRRHIEAALRAVSEAAKAPARLGDGAA